MLATQNPIDLQGTYPLPEAQLDRFFFKLIVDYPSPDELKEIARRTTGRGERRARVVMSGEQLRDLQALVRDVPVAEPVLDYASRLVLATHPAGEGSSAIARKLVRYGASPRAIQSLVLAGKVNAIMSGRYNVSFDDLRRVVLPALRHRIVLNVEAQLQNVDADTVPNTILEGLGVSTTQGDGRKVKSDRKRNAATGRPSFAVRTSSVMGWLRNFGGRPQESRAIGTDDGLVVDTELLRKLDRISLSVGHDLIGGLIG